MSEQVKTLQEENLRRLYNQINFFILIHLTVIFLGGNRLWRFIVYWFSGEWGFTTKASMILSWENEEDLEMPSQHGVSGAASWSSTVSTASNRCRGPTDFYQNKDNFRTFFNLSQLTLTLTVNPTLWLLVPRFILFKHGLLIFLPFCSDNPPPNSPANVA